MNNRAINNFKQDILDEVSGEVIEAIAVGQSRGIDYPVPDHSLGEAPVSWEEAAPILDYDYDADFGTQDCHNVYIWTPTRVIFVHEYDGRTWLRSVPRNPQDKAR